MEIFGLIFGSAGIGLGMFGFFAYMRITALEKKLKDAGVLDKNFDSEKSMQWQVFPDAAKEGPAVSDQSA